jgi:hypothetical protein
VALHTLARGAGVKLQSCRFLQVLQLKSVKTCIRAGMLHELGPAMQLRRKKMYICRLLLGVDFA